ERQPTMPRPTKFYLRRPTYTKPIPPGAKLFTRRGKRFARFADRDGNQVEAPLTASGQRIRLQTEMWHVFWRELGGVIRSKPLSPDKTMAQRMMAEIIDKDRQVKAGMRDRYDDHRERPLKEHVPDFEQSLRDKGNGDEYVELKLARLRRVLDGCGCLWLKDLDAAGLQHYIAELKETRNLSNRTASWHVQAVKQFSR